MARVIMPEQTASNAFCDGDRPRALAWHDRARRSIVFVYDASSLTIDQHSNLARTAQTLPTLRQGTAVFRVVPSSKLFDLRPGVRS
jgi:hypothetical protein